MPSNISIVIPTLNEADRLEATLRSLHSNSVAPREIIVADAGSTDQTCAIAHKANCQVLEGATRGRAQQMNLGAKASQGNILVFLHGDTQVPRSGLAEIQHRMESAPQVIGGAFSRRYDSPSRVLKWTCRLADWRGSLFGLFLGDQVIFVQRRVFEHLQGFRDLAAFEDWDFSRRMKKCGDLIRLRSQVISSARRFQRRGPMLTTFRDLRALWQFSQGKEVEEILRWLRS